MNFRIPAGQQWKHQNNVWNLLKVNNKHDMHFSGVSIVDSEQLNAGWELNAPTLSDSTILIAHCFQNCKFNLSGY